MENLKSKIILLILAVGLIGVLGGFAPTYAQNIRCEYFYIDTLQVSKKVFCDDYPNSEKTLIIFLDRLFRVVKFKDDIDKLTYYHFIRLMPTFCKDWEYEKAAKSVLENTNWWLKDQYYKYW